MASGYRVTEDEYRTIKSKLRWHSPLTVSEMMSRHVAIITKIHASNSYAQYRGIVAAEHPPRKTNSLTDRVEALEILVEGLKEEIQRLKTAKALELSHDCD